jgi:protein-disulfide isomerase
MNNKKKLSMAIIFFLIFVILAFLAIILVGPKNQAGRKPAASPTAGGNNQNTDGLLDFNQAALASANGQTQIPKISAADHIQGDLSAPIKIVVYEDLTDAYAVKFNDTLQTAVKTYGGKLAIAYRPFIINNSAAALEIFNGLDCAADQQKFLEMRQLILGENKAGQLSAANLGDYAKKLNLNADAFARCLASKKYEAGIAQTVKAAAGYSIFGAPTAFVNDVIVTGARSFADAKSSAGGQIDGLKTIIDRQLNSN